MPFGFVASKKWNYPWSSDQGCANFANTLFTLLMFRLSKNPEGSTAASPQATWHGTCSPLAATVALPTRTLEKPRAPLVSATRVEAGGTIVVLWHVISGTNKVASKPFLLLLPPPLEHLLHASMLELSPLLVPSPSAPRVKLD